MKSSAAQTTRAPRGTDAATRPANGDACGPIATSSAATLCRRANDARAAATDSSQPSKPVRPWRHSSAAAWSASNAARGGSPYEAVFSQAVSGEKRRQAFAASTLSAAPVRSGGRSRRGRPRR